MASSAQVGSVHEPFEIPSSSQVTEHTTIANLHLPSLANHQMNLPCARFCRFKLCNFDGTGSGSFFLQQASFVILSQENFAILPHVCLPSQTMGLIRAGEAQVFYNNRFFPISQFSPPNIPGSFPRNAIVPNRIDFTPWSGIGRSKISVDLWPFLNRQCMYLPIHSYQQLDPTAPRFVRNIQTERGPTDCVAFRTLAPLLHIQAVWDWRDDFDLSLEEPDGRKLDHFEPRSQSGRHNGDNNGNACSTTLTFGRENILYDLNKPIQAGEYRVQLLHSNSCEGRLTRWTVRVMMNGKEVRKIRGRSRAGNGAVVADFNFVFPDAGVNSTDAPLRDA